MGYDERWARKRAFEAELKAGKEAVLLVLVPPGQNRSRGTAATA